MTTGRINLVSIVQAGGRGRAGGYHPPVPSHGLLGRGAPSSVFGEKRGAGTRRGPTSRVERFVFRAVSSVDVVLLQKTLVRRQVGPDAVRARASSRAGGARERREEAEHFRRLPLNRS